MAERAYKMVNEKFTWDKIAAQTNKIYEEILEEYDESNWNKKLENTYINEEEERLAGSFKYE